MINNVRLNIVPPRTTGQTRRIGIRNGRPITYKSRDIETVEVTLDSALQVSNAPRITGEAPLALAVLVVWPYRRSDVSSKANRNRSDLIWHTSKPDLDNWMKLFLDALTRNKIIIDDKVISSMMLRKAYGPDNLVGIYFRLDKLDDPPSMM